MSNITVIYARAPYSQMFMPADNLEAQTRRCLVLAREKGLQVSRVHTDIGVPSDICLRPGLKAVYLSGDIKTVLVDAPDILARTVEMRADILYDLATLGKEVLFVDEQDLEETKALLTGIRKRAETDE